MGRGDQIVGWSEFELYLEKKIAAKKGSCPDRNEGSLRDPAAREERGFKKKGLCPLSLKTF